MEELKSVVGNVRNLRKAVFLRRGLLLIGELCQADDDKFPEARLSSDSRSTRI